MCYPSISPPSVIPLSTFCHLSGRERKTDKEKTVEERERQRDSWLACRLFGLIQEEDVESPLISNPHPPLPLLPLSTPSSLSGLVDQSVHLIQPPDTLALFVVYNTVSTTFMQI